MKLIATLMMMVPLVASATLTNIVVKPNANPDNMGEWATKINAGLDQVNTNTSDIAVLHSKTNQWDATTNAANISVADAGAYYTSNTVEGVLGEIADNSIDPSTWATVSNAATNAEITNTLQDASIASIEASIEQAIDSAEPFSIRYSDGTTAGYTNYVSALTNMANDAILYIRGDHTVPYDRDNRSDTVGWLGAITNASLIGVGSPLLTCTVTNASAENTVGTCFNFTGTSGLRVENLKFRMIVDADYPSSIGGDGKVYGFKASESPELVDCGFYFENNATNLSNGKMFVLGINGQTGPIIIDDCDIVAVDNGTSNYTAFVANDASNSYMQVRNCRILYDGNDADTGSGNGMYRFLISNWPTDFTGTKINKAIASTGAIGALNANLHIERGQRYELEPAVPSFMDATRFEYTVPPGGDNNPWLWQGWHVGSDCNPSVQENMSKYLSTSTTACNVPSNFVGTIWIHGTQALDNNNNKHTLISDVVGGTVVISGIPDWNEETVMSNTSHYCQLNLDGAASNATFIVRDMRLYNNSASQVNGAITTTYLDNRDYCDVLIENVIFDFVNPSLTEAATVYHVSATDVTVKDCELRSANGVWTGYEGATYTDPLYYNLLRKSNAIPHSIISEAATGTP